MIWIVIALIMMGIGAMVLEIFLPAGGVLGLAGLGSYVAGIVLTFRHFESTTGYIMLIASLLAAPVVFALSFRIFPRTFFGRRLILSDRQKTGSGFTSYSAERYSDLEGQEGVALTRLRPSGMARIAGRKYSVVTGGEMIEAGDPVRVSVIEGSRIVVLRARKDAPVRSDEARGTDRNARGRADGDRGADSET